MFGLAAKYYRTIVIQELQPNGGERWTASHPELLGCNATGKTAEDAVIGLERSRSIWLKAAEKFEYDIPEPTFDVAMYECIFDSRATHGADVLLGGSEGESQYKPVPEIAR